MEQLNEAGARILDILLIVAYWVTGIAGLGCIIREIARGDTHGAFKVGMGFIIAFATIYIFIWALDIVKGVFG